MLFDEWHLITPRNQIRYPAPDALAFQSKEPNPMVRDFRDTKPPLFCRFGCRNPIHHHDRNEPWNWNCGSWPICNRSASSELAPQNGRASTIDLNTTLALLGEMREPRIDRYLWFFSNSNEAISVNTGKFSDLLRISSFWIQPGFHLSVVFWSRWRRSHGILLRLMTLVGFSSSSWWRNAQRAGSFQRRHRLRLWTHTGIGPRLISEPRKHATKKYLNFFDWIWILRIWMAIGPLFRDFAIFCA